MHFLITGGAGFIGSHLAERLLADGQRVRVLDDFSTGKRENLAAFGPALEVVEGSVLDEGVLKRAVQGVNVILHEAALPSVARSIQNPLQSLQANALGTLKVLMAAKEAGVGRVVLASSSSVYGANPQLPKREDMHPMPMSPYAVSKLAGEHYAYVYHQVHGLETIALRYFNVFGPRQDPHSPYAAVIPKFLASMRAGKQPQIFGDGLQSRDFTYVDNVVAANLLAAKAPKEACGKSYNIASGGRYSLLDLVRRLNGILGTSLQPLFAEPRKGDVPHSQADVSQAKKYLGYEAAVSFDEGLQRLAARSEEIIR